MTDGRPGWPWLRLTTYGTFFVAGALLGIAALLLFTHPRTSTAPEPGRVDVGFAQDMAQHHAQALEMSQLALTRDSSPAIQAFARQIILTQAGEQGTLRGWLTLWKQPQLPAGPPMTWMHSAHAMRHGGMSGRMPGMATPTQMNRLGRLHGGAFDDEFLRLMTRHHLGGIEMARFAVARAQLQEVRSLAAVMVMEQTKEVAAFQQIRTARAGD